MKATNVRKSMLRNGNALPIALLSPTIFVVLVVMIIPLFYGLYISLFQYSVGGELSKETFVGLANYAKFFHDPLLLTSLKNTVIFALAATFGDMVIGTVISVVLLRLKKRVSAVLRGICTMPLLISPIIAGLIWKYMYDPTSGFLYWLLGLFGVTVRGFPGLTMPSSALLCIIMTHWWQITPFVILVVTAGLVAIPDVYYEAASIDGAGPFRSFFSISLPQLTNVYMVILIVSGVDTVKVFDIIYSLTQGGPANSTISLSIYAYRKAFEQYDMGYAMAIAMLTMIVALLLFGIPFLRSNRRKEA